ncbi:MAG: alpha/beta hydrolase [Saccharofermentanales bacterium]|jgi:monoterpene epsilon-lactone hydrolase
MTELPELSLRAKLAKRLLRLISRRRAQEFDIDERRSWPDLAGLLRQKRHPDLEIVPITIGGVECEWVYRQHGSPLTRPRVHEEVVDKTGQSVLIYFHGGGYVTGSLLSARVLSTSLAFEMPLRMLSVNYRLAPEHPFPAALLDALAVYDQLLADGWSPANIGFIGDSAGGGLALSAAMAIRDSHKPLPACIALISPWTDLTGDSSSFQEKAEEDVMLIPEEINEYAQFYAGENRPDNPYISPLFGNFESLPPMLVHVGSEELLLDDATRAVEKALAAGVDAKLKVWPGLFHVFSLANELVPEARESMTEIMAFLEAHLLRDTGNQKTDEISENVNKSSTNTL